MLTSNRRPFHKAGTFLSVREVPITRWSSPWPMNLRPRPLTLLMLCFGLILFGLGEALIIAAALGVSPWTVLAAGIALHTDWSIGMATFVVSIAILLLWIPLAQRPGIGTIANAVIIALTIDLALAWLPRPDLPGWQLFQVVLGVLVTGLGSGFYLVANLGPGARDGLMTGIQRKSGWPIAVVRALIECLAVVAGWLLGGAVGVGTLVFAFGIGPAVALGLSVVRAVSRPVESKISS